MTNRLPAVVQKPESDLDFWSERLRQWLLEQTRLTRERYGSGMQDFARWADPDNPDVSLAFSLLFLGKPEEVARRVQKVAIGYLDDLKTRPVWSSTQSRDRNDPPARFGLAPATIQLRMVGLRAVVNLAVHARFCPGDVRFPKTPKVRTLRDTRGVSRRQWLEILDTLDHTIDTAKPGSQQYDLAIRDYAIFKLLHDIGLRRAEVHDIQIEKITSDSIWISRKGDEDEERQEWPVAPEPLKAIARWLTIRGNPPQGPVFTSRKGKPLTLDAFNKLVEKWGQRSGAGHLHPHKLRHTAISTLARKTSGNLTGMQGFAGHSDPQMTMKYVHNEGAEIRALQELLGGNEDES